MEHLLKEGVRLGNFLFPYKIGLFWVSTQLYFFVNVHGFRVPIPKFFADVCRHQLNNETEPCLLLYCILYI